MDRRDLRLLLALTALSVAWLLVQGVTGVPEGVAMLVPAMLLALPLLAGRYVGEEAIERARLARDPVAPGRRRAPGRSPSLRATTVVIPRGGLLLASSLATRPPPSLG